MGLTEEAQMCSQMHACMHAMTQVDNYFKKGIGKPGRDANWTNFDHHPNMVDCCRTHVQAH
eukprot:1321813-Amphidinium_carterae.1